MSQVALRCRVAPAAVGLAIAFVVGACGGSGPAVGEWRAEADAVCTRHQQEADLSRPVLYQPTLAQTLRRSAEASAAEAQELRTLEKPRDQRDEVRDYLSALDDRVIELRRLAAEAEHPGEDFQAPSTDVLAGHTQKAAELARELRLTSCGAGIDVSIGATTTTTAPPGVDAISPSATDLKEWETQDQG